MFMSISSKIKNLNYALKSSWKIWTCISFVSQISCCLTNKDSCLLWWQHQRETLFNIADLCQDNNFAALNYFNWMILFYYQLFWWRQKLTSSWLISPINLLINDSVQACHRKSCHVSRSSLPHKMTQDVCTRIK